MSYLSIAKVWFGYVKRAAKVLPDLVLGSSSEVAGKAIKATKGDVFTKAKAGFKAVENLSSKGSFFTRITKNLGRIKSCTTAGIRAGAKKGFFGKITGGLKGLSRGLGKNMPFIGALMMIGFELPNIFKATSEKGLWQGVKETAKAGARLTGGAVGAAIGTAVCPFLGSLVGWIAGEWLTSKIVGKSYSEKKAEEEEALAQQTQQVQQMQQMQQPTFTGGMYDNTMSGMTNPMYNYNNFNSYNDYLNPYADDIMMQNMNFNMVA